MKARIKSTGETVEGYLDGKGHFDVSVDHCIFDRYDLHEVEIEQEPAAVLDAAALDYSNNYAMSEERRMYCIEDFKAGAGWLAEQGVTEAGTMGEFGIVLDNSVVARLADMFKEGDRVVVQYRKL